MTSNDASEQVAKPDYTKVRGWLLAFGIYAGWVALSGTVSEIINYGSRRDLVDWLPPTAAEFYVFSQYVGYGMLLLFLVQCVGIFRRLRFARWLSLVIFAAKFLMGVASLPYLVAVVEASIVDHTPSSVDLEAYTSAIKITLTVYAYVDAFLGLAIAVVGFLYFWLSNRVKQTLVN